MFLVIKKHIQKEKEQENILKTEYVLFWMDMEEGSLIHGHNDKIFCWKVFNIVTKQK